MVWTLACRRGKISYPPAGGKADKEKEENRILAVMELRGTWEKDEEGYLEFDTFQLQRLYETVTDSYYEVYNRYLEELEDEEAFYKAKEEGYELITDYKIIDGEEEFATTYHTPSYLMDIWYSLDPRTKKRIYTRGQIRIIEK